ncbi:MAG TPA: GNAT family N-acetyltransferase [Thermoanaerobaculia bacterium]|jgi:RimJ/RimL family protein N-acetyltransferase
MLRTERLSLSPVEPADLDALHAMWTAPGVRRYLWDDEIIPMQKTREAVAESERLFRTEGTGLWLVRGKESPQPIGFCGYWYFRTPPERELLYGIAEEHWGKGYATEAAVAMLRHGFEELGFAEIVASTDATNAASVRVMEKAGMRFLRRATSGGLDTIYYVAERGRWAPSSS